MLKGARDGKAILEMSVNDKEITEKNGHPLDAETNFLMSLRHRYWETLFTVPEFTAKLTANVQKDLHSRVDEFAHYDFSFYNIYSLYLEVSRELLTNIKKAILDLFEDFTHRHHYEEYSKNVHYYNGWRTNKAFKVNKKVIIPMHVDRFWLDCGSSDSYRLPWEFKSKLCDIEKVFDYLAGTSTPDHASLIHSIDRAGEQGVKRGIESRHFIISVFKKGTCHIEFKSPDLVKKFNIFGCQQKNWLPPGYGATQYAELDPEARDVVDSFEGEESYAQTLRKADYFLPSDTATPLLPLVG
jgi:hypothetical protein